MNICGGGMLGRPGGSRTQSVHNYTGTGILSVKSYLLMIETWLNCCLHNSSLDAWVAALRHCFLGSCWILPEIILVGGQLPSQGRARLPEVSIYSPTWFHLVTCFTLICGLSWHLVGESSFGMLNILVAGRDWRMPRKKQC
jgi:hypothetical protein